MAQEVTNLLLIMASDTTLTQMTFYSYTLGHIGVSLLLFTHHTCMQEPVIESSGMKDSKIIWAMHESGTEYLKMERIQSGGGASGHEIHRNSPVTVISDSDSDSGLIQTLVSSRKRLYVPTPPDVSDSDSNPPRSKYHCPHKKFPELKDEIQSRLQENFNSNKPLTHFERCLLVWCKSNCSRPLMLPCCRSAICCHGCMTRWLETSWGSPDWEL
jgi:hypothetical protein